MAVPMHSENLAEFKLTAENFPTFYNKLVAMRFPIPVDEVLELRDLLNHTSDVFDEPADTPQYQEFRDSLETAIQSFGITNERHCERLIKILTVMRSLHYDHSIHSRDDEKMLRERQADNRQARKRSVQFCQFAIFIMVCLGIAWVGVAEPGWAIKLGTLISAYLSWDYLHSLPILDREMKHLTQQLNETLRKRVNTLNWKTLIHKISLILGYKQIQGIEVFRRNQADDELPLGPRIYQ